MDINTTASSPLILVFYVDVANLDVEDIAAYMGSFQEKITQNKPENSLFYIFPLRNGHSRVECINPRVVGDAEFNKVKEVMDLNQKALDDVLSAINTKNNA